MKLRKKWTDWHYQRAASTLRELECDLQRVMKTNKQCASHDYETAVLDDVAQRLCVLFEAARKDLADFAVMQREFER